MSGRLISLLIIYILAKIESHNFILVDMHALQGFANNLLYILPGYSQIAIHQPDVIAFAHAHAADLHAAYSRCDLSRMHRLRGLVHRLAILLETGFEVEAAEGSHPLCHRISGNNMHLLAT